MTGWSDTAKMKPMPNKPKTPLRAIRISDEVWVAAQERALEDGRTVSDVVREALVKYGKKPRKR
ncbi:hypothetical protein [Cryobacterium arcticum]|uniref:Ribbon-helix-helix protein CopG domain-containing protein n=1 Tax=Cryobacterium arcticum TaxID=670052 RepID=A0A1B1BPD9_9MICO|nr:hypothetical protein [Cryobacterium arcticum]ANP74540.1 hypothetical protein PA27867_3622 [Cryobacterium arcticum]